MSGRITHAVLRSIDKAASILGKVDERDPRHRTGTRGEEEAYFHLRRLGYVIVARNYRSPRRHGEIDLIGWDGGTLCFIEVKTRSSKTFQPAEAAVDFEKQRDLRTMAREYLRHMETDPPCRFDVASVYLEPASKHPEITLLRDAFSVA